MGRLECRARESKASTGSAPCKAAVPRAGGIFSLGDEIKKAWNNSDCLIKDSLKLVLGIGKWFFVDDKLKHRDLWAPDHEALSQYSRCQRMLSWSS
jgi:hypothetical protein